MAKRKVEDAPAPRNGAEQDQRAMFTTAAIHEGTRVALDHLDAEHAFSMEVLADAGTLATVPEDAAAVVGDILARVRELARLVAYRHGASIHPEAVAWDAQTLIVHALWAMCGVDAYRNRVTAAAEVLGGSRQGNDNGTRARRADFILRLAHSVLVERGEAVLAATIHVMRTSLASVDQRFLQATDVQLITAARECGPPAKSGAAALAHLAHPLRALGVTRSETPKQAATRFRRVLAK